MADEKLKEEVLALLKQSESKSFGERASAFKGILRLIARERAEARLTGMQYGFDNCAHTGNRQLALREMDRCAGELAALNAQAKQEERGDDGNDERVDLRRCLGNL